MVVLGLILLLLGAGLGAGTILAARDATGQIHLSVLGFTRDAGPIELVVLGLAAMLLVALGWGLITGAARRRVRSRREEREQDRLDEVRRKAEADRAAHEQRVQAAGLRDEDLRRREEEIAQRHSDLDAREQEVARLEAAYREKVPPSVADVVMGRAEGKVSEGTATWADPSSE